MPLVEKMVTEKKRDVSNGKKTKQQAMEEMLGLYKKVHGKEFFCNGAFLKKIISYWPNFAPTPVMSLLEYSFNECSKKTHLLREGKIKPVRLSLNSKF